MRSGSQPRANGTQKSRDSGTRLRPALGLLLSVQLGDRKSPLPLEGEVEQHQVRVREIGVGSYLIVSQELHHCHGQRCGAGALNNITVYSFCCAIHH